MFHTPAAAVLPCPLSAAAGPHLQLPCPLSTAGCCTADHPPSAIAAVGAAVAAALWSLLQAMHGLRCCCWHTCHLRMQDLLQEQYQEIQESRPCAAAARAVDLSYAALPAEAESLVMAMHGRLLLLLLLLHTCRSAQPASDPETAAAPAAAGRPAGCTWCCNVCACCCC